ncbi:MAG: hypothetical protein HY288_12715 [Planctomycetia bacterium]|nr:hypothetical protein [Planctomycetia bacterium]
MAAMIDAPAKPFRHPFRFALPLAFLALGILGGWVAWSANQVRQRDAMLTEIELAEGSIVFPSGETRSAAIRENLPVVWRMCGAKPVWWILLPEQGFSKADQARIRNLFPEAHVAPLSHGSSRPE